MSNGNPPPRVMRPILEATDPTTACARYCDALGRESTHRKLTTWAGDYWLCMETGQLVRDEFPPHQEEQYDAYWQDMQQVQPPEERKVERRAKWLKRLEPYRKTGRLFEVGCGQGLTLCAAHAAGWKAEGSEVAATAAALAEKFSGAKVHVGNTETMQLDEGAFDVVLCDNVFEHFHTPSAAMRTMARALRPGGLLYLQTLNSASMALAKLPHDWFYFAEVHLYVPNRISLEHYCDANGLRMTWHRTHGYSSSPRLRATKAGFFHRKFDKLAAAYAARIDRGHRIECMMKRA